MDQEVQDTGASVVSRPSSRLRAVRWVVAVLAIVWFHRQGHLQLRFPFRPWYRKKREPSFADILTTLRTASYHEKTKTLLSKRYQLKTWIAQITEFLSRAG